MEQELAELWVQAMTDMGFEVTIGEEINPVMFSMIEHCTNERLHLYRNVLTPVLATCYDTIN